jgi:PhzF family phenazine biosynthesis protein
MTSIYQVDAFTSTPFTGNAAAVCIEPPTADDRWLQDVATEMNVGATAFLWRNGSRWKLRWFAPAAELTLCGHATLASAHILWEAGLVSADEPLEFETRSGILRASRQGRAIALDFPAERAEPAASDAVRGVLQDAQIVWIGRNRLDFLVELKSEAAVRAAAPDLTKLAAIQTRGLIVTAPSDDPRYDFVSRFFAPALGIPEDPVTGSAHCALGPYWAARLDKQELIGYQASRRSGVVGIAVAGERVTLSGEAVTVLRGELMPVPPRSPSRGAQ